MTPKLLALDLDDTTLNLESRLSPGNKAALLRAKEMGLEIVIASGRAYETLPKEMLCFPGIHYAICSNGAGVYEVSTGKAILHRTIPPTAVASILKLCRGEHLTYEAFLDGKAYCDRSYVEDPYTFGADEIIAAYVRSARRPVENILDFIREHIEDLDALDLVVGSQELKQKMMGKLEIVDGVYITSSVPRLIEISRHDCGKHRALEFLCDKLGIQREAVIAFGNGDNDAEMLSWAGVGVAVGNATAACKAAADLVAEDYLEDGVAKALGRLL